MFLYLRTGSLHQAHRSLEKTQRIEQNNDHREGAKGSRKSTTSRISIHHGFIRFMGFLFLLCFGLSSVSEAGQTTTPRHTHIAKKKIERSSFRKKPQQASRARTRSQRASRARIRPQRASGIRNGAQRVSSVSRLHPRTSYALTIASPAPILSPVSIAPPAPIIPPVLIAPPVSIAPPAPIIPPISPLTYLSQLPPHTQKNAQLGGLDKLYSQDLSGQGKIVAVVEESGTWKTLRDVISGTQGNLFSERRENYRNNFLPAIGGGTLPPEETNAWIRSTGHLSHGSDVSSVILDLSQAKVLPVSTYDTPGSPDAYDVADAVMDLSQRADVNIINISAGNINFTVTSQAVRDENGMLQFGSKTVYTPKFAEAFQAVARAGKVVVLAVGNNGKDIQPPQFKQDAQAPRSQIMGHLVEALDPETRQSVIFAGAFNPKTCVASDYSNKPGNWPEAQERFLFAPGRHLPAYSDCTVGGTSYAAPYICAAIANLCSMPGVTPKRAVKALLETADQRPEKAIYGRGVIRADKALEWLEAGN